MYNIIKRKIIIYRLLREVSIFFWLHFFQCMLQLMYQQKFAAIIIIIKAIIEDP